MIRTLKINNVKIKPIDFEYNTTGKEVRGKEYFSEPYGNCFIVAKKKSGKSTVIANLLKKLAGRDTKIIIFCATVNKDDTYKHIQEHFEKKGNTVITYTSIKEGGNDNLNDILEMLRGGDDETDEEEEAEKLDFIITNETKEKKKRKKREEKLLSPEIIFVFDDLSKELRYPSVATLLKSNRHYKSKVIMSSQYLYDLKPESIRQLDYMLVFSGQTMDKLEKIHEGADLSLPFDTFVQYYNYATNKRFNFLYIDTTNEHYRKNFNEEILFSNPLL